jgi:hypothetical protein
MIIAETPAPAATMEMTKAMVAIVVTGVVARCPFNFSNLLLAGFLSSRPSSAPLMPRPSRGGNKNLSQQHKCKDIFATAQAKKLGAKTDLVG